MKGSQETKRTVPVPSVGADGEQPISQKRTSSIAEKADESNPQEKRLERCYSYSARLDAVSAENKSLREEVRDYERLKRAIGPDQASMMLEAARQQEQTEKERKRAARRKADLDAR